MFCRFHTLPIHVIHTKACENLMGFYRVKNSFISEKLIAIPFRPSNEGEDFCLEKRYTRLNEIFTKTFYTHKTYAIYTIKK